MVSLGIGIGMELLRLGADGKHGSFLHIILHVRSVSFWAYSVEKLRLKRGACSDST